MNRHTLGTEGLFYGGELKVSSLQRQSGKCRNRYTNIPEGVDAALRVIDSRFAI